QVLAPQVGSILPNSPVSQTSLTVGDDIVAVDNKPIQSWQDINYALADRMGESGQVNLTVNGAQGQTNVAVPIQRFMKVEAGKATNPID
ncbi:PDZ domain-containing protein, partial [Mycobacterium tuberculosis]|nr:PDZ domain-containing protein [Mycobacterium tuberculosis]